VLVITKMQDVAPASDLAASQRAADVLAERLPGVPDKPASPGATQADRSGAVTGPAMPNAAAGAGTKPNSPRTAAKPPSRPPMPPHSSGTQAKPTQDSAPAPDLKPISQRMP
jgi:hypothetical protein